MWVWIKANYLTTRELVVLDQKCVFYWSFGFHQPTNSPAISISLLQLGSTISPMGYLTSQTSQLRSSTTCSVYVNSIDICPRRLTQYHSTYLPSFLVSARTRTRTQSLSPPYGSWLAFSFWQGSTSTRKPRYKCWKSMFNSLGSLHLFVYFVLLRAALTCY
jgi:hypothetical protein